MLAQKNLTIIDKNYEQLKGLSKNKNVIIIETTPNTLGKIDMAGFLDGKYELTSIKSFKSPPQAAEYFVIDYLIHRFNMDRFEDLIEKYTIKISISGYRRISETN